MYRRKNIWTLLWLAATVDLAFMFHFSHLKFGHAYVHSEYETLLKMGCYCLRFSTCAYWCDKFDTLPVDIRLIGKYLLCA